MFEVKTMLEPNIHHPSASGKPLRNLRSAARLSQSELADLSGIRRDRICYAEMGRLELRPQEVEIIRGVVADEFRTIQAQVVAALLARDSAIDAVGA
jgi:transcriptional regulator with XRE-family HTH domain